MMRSRWQGLAQWLLDKRVGEPREGSEGSDLRKRKLPQCISLCISLTSFQFLYLVCHGHYCFILIAGPHALSWSAELPELISLGISTGRMRSLLKGLMIQTLDWLSKWQRNAEISKSKAWNFISLWCLCSCSNDYIMSKLGKPWARILKDATDWVVPKRNSHDSNA